MIESKLRIASRIACTLRAVIVKYEVGVRHLFELGPAHEISISIVHFVHAEVADSLLVADGFAVLVHRNGLLNNVHRYVFFNFVPVFDIFFFLLNRLEQFQLVRVF